MPEQFSQVVEDLLYCKEFGLMTDPDGIVIKEIIQRGIAGSFENKTLKQQVSHHRIEQAFAGQFPLPKLHHGDLVLGKDVKGREIRIPSNYLNEHTYIQGTTGSGKSTLARWLLLQMARIVLGIFVFDFRKRDFANLAPLFNRIGKELIVFEARQLRINPLEIPTGTSVNDYACNIAEMLARILLLPPGATKILYCHSPAPVHAIRDYPRRPTLPDPVRSVQPSQQNPDSPRPDSAIHS